LGENLALGGTYALPTKNRAVSDLDSVTVKKTLLFIVTSMGTSNPAVNF
jgi:hypothetical protein